MHSSMDETEGDLDCTDSTKKSKTVVHKGNSARAQHPGAHKIVKQQHDSGECIEFKDDGKSHVTLVGGSCAAGNSVPAMVIFSCAPSGSIPLAATQNLPVSTTNDRTTTGDATSMFSPPPPTHTHTLHTISINLRHRRPTHVMLSTRPYIPHRFN